MPYDYVYEPEESMFSVQPEENTPNYLDYPVDYNSLYQEDLERPGRVIAMVELFILYPLVMVLNLLLFIATITNERGRKEPWRWSIAHASFLMFLQALLICLGSFTSTLDIPSLASSPVCPAVSVAVIIIWNMIKISATLVGIERFRALLLGTGDEGGMGKKAVILSLSLFWLFFVITISLPLALSPALFGKPAIFIGYQDIAPGLTSCYASPKIILSILRDVMLLFNSVTQLVIIIGTVVLACKKSTTPEMKHSIVAPTLTFAIFIFIFIFFPQIFDLSIAKSSAVVLGYTSYRYHFLEILNMFFLVVFPIIWLTTWSGNGDILWKKTCGCCHGDENEKRHLLEMKSSK